MARSNAITTGTQPTRLKMMQDPKLSNSVRDVVLSEQLVNVPGAMSPKQVRKAQQIR